MRNALIALLLLTATAVAQPAMAPIQDPEMPAGRTTPMPEEVASDNVSTAVAVGTTLAGMGLTLGAIRYGSSGAGVIGIGAMVAGPSAGHFYSGEWGHALGMTALRTTGALVFFLGLIESSTEANISDGGGTHHDNGSSLMAIGAAVYVATTVYDIYDSGRAARRANAHALAVVPSVGQSAVGMTLAGQF
jgi:hypothetical protein